MAEPMKDLTIWLTSSAWSPSGWLVRVAVVVALFASFWTPAHAQTIEGHLLDGSTQVPIPGGVVTLVAEAGQALERVEADSLGHFSITAASAGSYYLRAERIGYATKTEGVFDLGRDGKLEIEFYILPEAIELEGIEVRGERTDWIKVRETERLEGQGFFDRQKGGFGYFVTPEAIEERPPMQPRDLFGRIPGVRTGNVTGVPGSDGIVTMDCAPPTGYTPRVDLGSGGGFAVYVNGIRVYVGTIWDSRSDIAMGDVAAVEVYPRIAMLPIEYATLGVCGVILIWTR